MAYHLLIVDDGDLTRRNLVIFFEQFGDSVHEAATGAAALELISQTNFDVVISDLRLPGSLNGIDVLKHCAKIHPKSRLVLITAFGSDDVRSEADGLGALYYEKPISLETLRAAIEASHPHS